jgi:hypothetical protein
MRLVSFERFVHSTHRESPALEFPFRAPLAAKAYPYCPVSVYRKRRRPLPAAFGNGRVALLQN